MGLSLTTGSATTRASRSERFLLGGQGVLDQGLDLGLAEAVPGERLDLGPVRFPPDEAVAVLGLDLLLPAGLDLGEGPFDDVEFGAISVGRGQFANCD